MTHLVSLRYSNDGGENESMWQSRESGSTGAFLTQLVWRRLGFARERIWEICDTSNVAADVLGMSIDMESE
jgi:hypothetical protein